MAIYGKIGDIVKQSILNDKIKLGLTYLLGLDKNFLSGKPAGYSEKVEICGKEVYAIHQVNSTKPASQARFEAHRKYVDLQYVWEGEEIISITSPDKLTTIIPYDFEKDVIFYKYFRSSFLVMKPEILAILYPSDVHAAGIAFKKQQLVKKTVVKVRVL